MTSSSYFPLEACVFFSKTENAAQLMQSLKTGSMGCDSVICMLKLELSFPDCFITFLQLFGLKECSVTLREGFHNTVEL